MARFACAAMDKFREVLGSLELKLGPDTVGEFIPMDKDSDDWVVPYKFFGFIS